MSIQDQIQIIGQNAKKAADSMAQASCAQKNQALQKIAHLIRQEKESLQQANQIDIDKATASGLDAALLDRLTLNDKAIETMALGLEQIIQLPDPVGEISDLKTQPSGIQVGKMRVPLGVIGIIYESRPNVTVDAAGLCIKSGNATILRGGSEAFKCNQALAQLVSQGLEQANLPAQAVQVINTTNREAVGHLITANNYVDVIVPRGGKSLIERIAAQATVPVIKHLDGNCHTYIDAQAHVEQAIKIADNAKTHRYGTCNTMETLLIHKNIAQTVLAKLAPIYLAKKVELRGCAQTCELVPQAKQATENDWTTEYLAPILAIRIVDSVNDAIDHINRFGSQHTDVIVTENHTNAMQFIRRVDSSSVMINASSRFADGFEYGLGAEIGISTNKLHARGPVGLEGLTSQKYIVFGHGETRS